MMSTFDDPQYMYYHINGYIDYNSDNSNNWHKEEYVSQDSRGTIIGHFRARIDRNTRSVSSLAAINFEPQGHGALFAIDFRRFIDKLFTERNYYRITFCVITKNPIMSMYDKFIREYNGRVVGTFLQSDRLSDGKLYDCKHYEMFRKDYIQVKNRRGAMNNDDHSSSSLDERTGGNKLTPSL